MSDTIENKKATLRLKRRGIIALISIVCAIAAVVTATFAWYIYNTTAKTTKVELAAGAGRNLQISNNYNGPYGYTTVLDSFVGSLIPVSTDYIDDGRGFQRAATFVQIKGRDGDIAATFNTADGSIFYKTTLYLKALGSKMSVYISDISWQDSDEENPISTAIRIGVVPHNPGNEQTVTGDEYIFQLNKERNPMYNYNTLLGYEGCVLDHTKTDGSTIDFTDKLLSSDNFCQYNAETNEVTVDAKSAKICELEVNEDGSSKDAVQVDIYIWLEGCDEDCIDNLGGRTLKNITVNFVGDVK